MINFSFNILKPKYYVRIFAFILLIFIVSKLIPKIPTQTTPSNTPFSTPTLPDIPSSTAIPDTTPVSESVLKQGAQQAAADYEVGKVFATNINKYPFIVKLPIITNKYTLIYDWDKSAIRVRIANHSIIPAEIESEIRQKLSVIHAPDDILLDYLY
jgi:hypothetical protein